MFCGHTITLIIGLQAKAKYLQKYVLRNNYLAQLQPIDLTVGSLTTEISIDFDQTIVRFNQDQSF